jgi:hypothetical protein
MNASDYLTELRLEAEMDALMAIPDGAERPRLFDFSLAAVDLYTLVAALQLASRHPFLSETQRDLIDRQARLLAASLSAVAERLFGPGSALAQTLADGFDPSKDDLYDEPEPDLDDGSGPIDDDVPGGLPDGAYVEPSFVAPDPELADAELSKCARCSRFFVSLVPVRLFQTIEADLVLGYELCDGCAGVVLGIRRADPGGLIV